MASEPPPRSEKPIAPMIGSGGRFRGGSRALAWDSADLMGAIGGAIAALPAVSLARALALRLGSVPPVAGAERAAGDVKLATFFEVAAIVLVIPAFSAFFGRFLPRFLERRARPGRLSFQWAGVAAGAVAWISKRDAPAAAIAAGCVAGLLTAGLFLAVRNSFAVRRVLSRRHRRSLSAIAGAGFTWELARLSSVRGARPLSSNILLDLAIGAALPVTIALLLSRLRGGFSDAMTSIGSACGLSFALAGAGIAVPGALPPALAASAGVFLLAPWVRFPDRPRWSLAGAFVFLFACGWTTYYQPNSPVDLFEDGHALAFAKAYSTGAAPFRDTFPVHGWGVDGGVDGLVFRWTPPTLKVFRIRRAVFTALALPALAAACAAILGSLGWALAAFALSLGICPFVSERHLLVFVALACLGAGVRRERMRYLGLAGVLSAAGLFFALDMGIIVLVGGVVGLGVVVLRWRHSAPLAAFLTGVLVGAIPFLGILTSRGALGAFFRVSFRAIPREILATWGLPLPPLLVQPLSIHGVLDALRGTPPTVAFYAVLVSVCVIVLLFRTRWSRDDFVILPALAIAALALRGAAGRADPGHSPLYGVFAGLPAAWLLRRAVRSSRGRAAVAAAFLWIGIHPLPAIEVALTVVARATRARLDRAAGMTPLPAGGGALVPAAQAADLAALRTVLDNVMGPRDTFFDFSNEPALYFLLDRRMPIPYLGPEFYESEGAQRLVISLCERERTPVAIAKAGNGLDAIDGVSNDARASLVAAYLQETFRPLAVVGGRVLLVRAERQPP